jgi:predicted GNAT family N-acyltransferase
MLKDKIIIYSTNDSTLTATEFISLFGKLWKARLDEIRVRASLRKTINITGRTESRSLVGCLRLISDDYMSTHVTEVLVSPEYRNTCLSEKLLELAFEVSPSGISFACQSMSLSIAEKLGWQKGPVSFYKRKSIM